MIILTLHFKIANSYFKFITIHGYETYNHSIDLNPNLKDIWKLFGYICSHTVFEKFDQNIADKINLLLDQNTNYNLTISKSLFEKLKNIYKLMNFFSQERKL